MAKTNFWTETALQTAEDFCRTETTLATAGPPGRAASVATSLHLARCRYEPSPGRLFLESTNPKQLRVLTVRYSYQIYFGFNDWMLWYDIYMTWHEISNMIFITVSYQRVRLQPMYLGMLNAEYAMIKWRSMMVPKPFYNGVGWHCVGLYVFWLLMLLSQRWRTTHPNSFCF